MKNIFLCLLTIFAFNPSFACDDPLPEFEIGSEVVRYNQDMSRHDRKPIIQVTKDLGLDRGRKVWGLSDGSSEFEYNLLVGTDSWCGYEAGERVMSTGTAIVNFQDANSTARKFYVGENVMYFKHLYTSLENGKRYYSVTEYYYISEKTGAVFDWYQKVEPVDEYYGLQALDYLIYKNKDREFQMHQIQEIVLIGKYGFGNVEGRWIRLPKANGDNSYHDKFAVKLTDKDFEVNTQISELVFAQQPHRCGLVEGRDPSLCAKEIIDYTIIGFALNENDDLIVQNQAGEKKIIPRKWTLENVEHFKKYQVGKCFYHEGVDQELCIQKIYKLFSNDYAIIEFSTGERMNSWVADGILVESKENVTKQGLIIKDRSLDRQLKSYCVSGDIGACQKVVVSLISESNEDLDPFTKLPKAYVLNTSKESLNNELSRSKSRMNLLCPSGIKLGRNKENVPFFCNIPYGVFWDHGFYNNSDVELAYFAGTAIGADVCINSAWPLCFLTIPIGIAVDVVKDAVLLPTSIVYDTSLIVSEGVQQSSNLVNRMDRRARFSRDLLNSIDESKVGKVKERKRDIFSEYLKLLRNMALRI